MTRQQLQDRLDHFNVGMDDPIALFVSTDADDISVASKKADKHKAKYIKGWDKEGNSAFGLEELITTVGAGLI